MGIPQDPIAVVSDYCTLIDALRLRKKALRLSDEMVDVLANLTRGHTGKLLGAAMAKTLGPISFGALLSTLGVKLLVVEDDDAMMQMRAHYKARTESSVRVPNPLSIAVANVSIDVMKKRAPNLLRAVGRKGGLNSAAGRMSKLTPAKRSRIARHAALARWRRHAKR